MYMLQNRWKLRGNQLVYYGLRSGKHLFHNRVRISSRQRRILESLPRELLPQELHQIKSLLHTCVVEESEFRPTPQSLDEAVFCTRCCANNYMIPGLEFDENGLCPLCQTKDQVTDLRSLVPIVTDIPKARHSRFDCALFYTGGKDSTFLLYHLSKVMGLRVLALTWEIPFMSDSARKSMENARKVFPNVEFISRCMAASDLKILYRKLYQLSENTCACPSLAYVLFYPELVENCVPYFLAGNEPAQILGLYYNHMAPKLAYRFPDSKILNGLVNIGRLLTLRPPLKRGQFQTLATMRKLAWGGNLIQTLTGYRNELVDPIVDALLQVPHLLSPLRRSIRRSSATGNIPAFVHLDLDKISGGRYDWRFVRETIIRECGWVPPAQDGKSLHTSCSIEKCKEYTQFQRFYHCRSTMIPFSALEIAIASQGRNLSREEAIREIRDSLGFSLSPIPECAIMEEFLKEEA